MIQCREVSKRFWGIRGPRPDFVSRRGRRLRAVGSERRGQIDAAEDPVRPAGARSGEVRIAGFDVLKEPLLLKRSIGVLPEDLGAVRRAHRRGASGSVRAGLRAEPRRKRARARRALLRILGLEKGRYTYLDQCSHGMRKKTALAMALLHNPRVLLLDEPFEGIDPVSSVTIRDLLIAVSGARHSGVSDVARAGHDPTVGDRCDDDSRRAHRVPFAGGGAGPAARRIVFRSGRDAPTGGPAVAALRAILKALRRAVGRDLGTLRSRSTTSSFCGVAGYGALNAGQPPKALSVLYAAGLSVVVSAFLRSAGQDPSRRGWRCGRSRAGQRLGLRLASLALSPVAWIGVADSDEDRRGRGWRWRSAGWRVGMQGAWRWGGTGERDPHWNVCSSSRNSRGGWVGWCARICARCSACWTPTPRCSLALAEALYRLFGRHPDPAAFAILGLLVALTMSTYAQSLFGLEIGSGSGHGALSPVAAARLGDSAGERHRVSGDPFCVVAAARSRRRG